MTITQKLQNAFPGITTLITGVVRGFRAGSAYNLEMRGIKTLCSEVPINTWMLKISNHSPLSYYDAYRIVTFLAEESKPFKTEPNKVTQFIIELACKGHTVDGILVFLQQRDIALSHRGCEKVGMRLYYKRGATDQYIYRKKVNKGDKRKNGKK